MKHQQGTIFITVELFLSLNHKQICSLFLFTSESRMKYNAEKSHFSKNKDSVNVELFTLHVNTLVNINPSELYVHSLKDTVIL